VDEFTQSLQKMNMIFQNAIGSFTKSEQTALRSRLLTLANHSRIGRQVEQNLWNEHRLPLSAAEQLLNRLIKIENEPNLLKKAYVEACRQLILNGSKIKTSRPIVLGRAVSRDAFLRILKDSGMFSDLDHARSWLTWVMTLNPKSLAQEMKKLPIGRSITWATFSRTNPRTNPFRVEGLPSGADDIRDALGLNPFQRGEPLLLFVYMPLSDVEFLFGIRPQPEIVHRPVFGDTLVERLECRLP
jgi:hypothetical protein